MSPRNAQEAAQLLHALMLKFLKWFLREKAGRDPVRWRLLLWDMAVTPCPEHHGYQDAEWPAWRLYGHALGYVGQYDQISKRAALRGFKSVENVHKVLSQVYGDAFDAHTKPCQAWRQLAEYVQSHQGDVIEQGEQLSSCSSDFRGFLEPAEIWEKVVAETLAPSLRRTNYILAVAHYLESYSEYLPAVALGVRDQLAELVRGLSVNIVTPWNESLTEAVQGLAPAVSSLLIVLVTGVASFPDLEQGLTEAADRRLRVLVFCPNAATAKRIEDTRMPSDYSTVAINLSPWYRPEVGEPAPGDVPQEAQDIIQRTALLDALASFSALHGRPTLQLLEAITEVAQTDIEHFLKKDGSGWVDFDSATGRAHWADQYGSVRYLEKQFTSDEELALHYATAIQRLAEKTPRGWERAVVNLLKSMYQTGRLRLLRRVLAELRQRDLSPANLLKRFPDQQEFQARLDLARVHARARLYEEAHELLLEAEVASDSQEFLDHQLLCAEILTEQLADTGKILFFEAAQFIYDDLAKKAVTNASLQQELVERKAELLLAAGRPQEALNLLNGLRQLSLLGQALKARALAESGEFELAARITMAASHRWRGIQLQRLPGETQDAFEQRWNDHVRQLLEKPASATPVEAFHQAIIRALERGHFQTASQLLEHATRHYRDNVHLAVARARLRVETGQPDQAIEWLRSVQKELTGQDNVVVQGALDDARLERFKNDPQRPPELSSPIFSRNFRKEHYLPAQQVRLLTLWAKAFWYGASPESPEPGTMGAVSGLPGLLGQLSQIANPAALNLAARILAAHKHWNDAIDKVDDALGAAQDPQSKVRTLNTKARILLNYAAAGVSSGVNPLAAADEALQESEKLDAGNTYTMLLRAEWLEREGRILEAKTLRQQADGLRQVRRDGWA